MAQNDFLPFAIGATANVTPQAAWAASGVLTNGQVAGYAKSADNNKAVRQPSFISAGLAEWVNRELVTIPILDDANLNEWINNLDAALRKLILSYIRIKATGAVTVYVSTNSGNDSNSGLSTSAPFKTIQAGINYMLDNIDLGPFQATVMIEGGTYNESVLMAGNPLGSLGLGQMQLQTYNGQVVWTGSGYTMNLSGGSNLVFNGNFLMSCVSTGFGPNGVICPIGGSRSLVAYGSNFTFGNSPGCAHVYTAGGGEFGAKSYTVAGGGTIHWYCAQNGLITCLPQGNESPPNIVFQNTPNFTNAFCQTTTGGITTCAGGTTFTGALPTGTKFLVTTNAIINTNGAGVGYLPGTVAGVEDTSTGGHYV